MYFSLPSLKVQARVIRPSVNIFCTFSLFTGTFWSITTDFVTSTVLREHLQTVFVKFLLSSNILDKYSVIFKKKKEHVSYLRKPF